MAETASSLRRNDVAKASNGMNEPEMSDPVGRIVAACQEGDRTAQRELYDLCHEGVYRLAVRMVGLQDATDVTQQAFLQAFRKVNQFSGHAKFETWLYRLTVNESLQHLRRRRRWTTQVLKYEPMDESCGHEGDSEHKELLEQALSRIDPELRSAFLLREVEGFSYRQIAESLQIPEGTVGSRLNRARHELQRHLKDLGWEP